MSDIEKRVKTVIARNRRKEVEEIGSDMSFNDLGVDSLSFVEVMMELDKELGVDIPDEEAQKMSNVRHLIDYIRANKKAGS
ncbi:acyl carrier protein [Streptomyces flaveolus]|uniref:acyl carrier protein n=1 Tax=Streptomyces flaveolus TaxID=67297 RepID=UPI0036FA0BF5